MRPFIFFIALFFVSCKQSPKQKDGKIIILPSQNLGKKYFNYDSIIYYNINFHDSLLPELNHREDESDLDSFKREVILRQIPKTIEDVKFIDELEKIGFQRKTLNKSSFNGIDSVFCEKPSIERYATTCGQIYRDILIFKKEKKVVGVAKICFSCGDYMIVGTNANTEGFEQYNAYSKLDFILKQN